MAPPTSLATTTVSLALVMTAPPERRRRSPHKDALSAHKAFVRETLALPRVRWVRTMNDLITIPAGSLGVLFSMQYAPNGLTEVAVKEWKSARLQSMAPFSSGSEYGGGFASDGGLTERGRMLIEWMSKCGIILDLSNAGHRTAREALAFIRHANVPVHVVASHSGCYSAFPHPRNLPDDVLRGIADMGGYVGTPVRTPVFAGGSGDPLQAFVRHISWTSRVCGSDAVGVGSSVATDFKTLEQRLERHFEKRSVVEGYLGRNFEYFLLRPLP